MKKNPDKQAETTQARTQINYPKVHTKAHLNAYKVPIADLLNPDCPISAYVSDNLRAELIKKQAKGAQYHYIDDYMFSYEDITATRGVLAKQGEETRKRIEQAQLTERYHNERPAIANMETALDPDNPLSVMRVDDTTRQGILAVKTVADAIAPELPPDALTFFLENFDKVSVYVRAALKEKGLDLDAMALTEVVQAVSIADAIRAAGYEPVKEKTAAPQMPPARPELLEMPIDNLSVVAYSRLFTDKRVKKVMPGQISMLLQPGAAEQGHLDAYDVYAVNTSHEGDKDPAFITFAMTSLDPAIAKQLTEYDKRVAVSVFGLILAGLKQFGSFGFVMTVNQIAYSMGIDRNPNDKDYKNINESLTKFRAISVFIENHYESQKYKSRSYEKYDSSFLSFERKEVFENGKKTTYIHPLTMPPLLAFAISRKQITTIKRAWLAVNTVSQNETTLGLQHYFLEWVAMLKNKTNNSNNPQITYKRLAEIVNVKGKQKDRLPDKVKKILAYYKDTGFIKDYEETEMKDGKGIKLSL